MTRREFRYATISHPVKVHFNVHSKIAERVESDLVLMGRNGYELVSVVVVHDQVVHYFRRAAKVRRWWQR